MSSKEEEEGGAVHVDGPASLLPTATIATLPVGSFLENIAVRPNGALLVTSMSDGTLYQAHPPAAGTGQLVEKAEKVFSWEQAEATGIVEHPAHPDTFFISVGQMNQRASWALWEIRFDGGDDGSRPVVSRFVDVPDALWLNGSTILKKKSTILLADSLEGRIYEVHIATGKVGVWLSHPLLGKMTKRPPWPGVNGLDVFEDEVYATNSDRGLLLKASVNKESGEYVPDSLEVIQENVCGDDFAFDAQGSLYMATNPNQTVLKFPDRGKGGRIRVAGAEDDEELTGATAVAFGRTEGDRASIYVTTTGGLVKPTTGKDGPGLARLVRVDVGVAGGRR